MITAALISNALMLVKRFSDSSVQPYQPAPSKQNATLVVANSLRGDYSAAILKMISRHSMTSRNVRIGLVRVLFRNNANRKNDHGRAHKHRAHVGEAIFRQQRPAIPTGPEQEERDAGRCEQLERRIQRGDLEDDQQESDAIAQLADVALADTLGDRDRHVGHRIGAAEERHSARSEEPTSELQSLMRISS